MHKYKQFTFTMLAWWKLAVLLGLMFLVQASVAFYLHPVSPTTSSSCATRTTVNLHHLPTTTKRGHSLPHLCATVLTTDSTTTATNTDNAQEQQEDAANLLHLLLHSYRLDKPPSDGTRQVIADSITRLAQAQVSFDPVECFNGPLFAVLHQQGPTKSLWETIGLSLWNNIKGQKYTYLSDTQDYEVTNYAEISGNGLFIQVEGTAKERKTPSLTKNDNNTSSGTTNSNATEFDFWKGLSNLFPQSSQQQQPQPQQQPSRLLQCPCDIVATVNGGGLYLWGNKVLDLPMIQGTGVVRVLYADPYMRIFESPYQDNTGWEDQGLIVVQVRHDLL